MKPFSISQFKSCSLFLWRKKILAGRSVRYLVAPLFRAQVCAGPMCPAGKTEIRSSIGRNSPHIWRNLCTQRTVETILNVEWEILRRQTSWYFELARICPELQRCSWPFISPSSKPYFAIKSFVRAQIGWLEH